MAAVPTAAVLMKSRREMRCVSLEGVFFIFFPFKIIWEDFQYLRTDRYGFRLSNRRA
jgi:hypothetical protein